MVDDEDYDYLMQWSWRLFDQNPEAKNTDYAIRVKCRGDSGTKHMHRLIMQRYQTLGQRDVIDHRDANGLNNCKANLRVCTHSQNSMHKVKNRGPHSSRYKGVSLQKRVGRWRAELMAGRKRVYHQLFDDERDAAIAYDIKAREHFGAFAKCNFTDIPSADILRLTPLLKP